MPIVTLANKIFFNCSSGQTILEGASLSSVNLDYSCKSGRCGVCKAKVISGTTRAIKPENSLADNEKLDGYILTCVRTADSDVLLDIEDSSSLETIKVRTLPCRIEEKSLLNDDVLEVVLRTPPPNFLAYWPGQYIDVIGRNGIRRSYSLANAPRPDGRVKLQIKRVINGEFSHYWFHEAECNDLLRIEGPLGTFYLRPTNSSTLILIATGTGIAPLRAILEDLSANPSKNCFESIYLYWGGRTLLDIYWEPDYPNLPLIFKPVLSRVNSMSAIKMYVQDAVIADGLSLLDADVYACGSQLMISSAKKTLIDAGLCPKKFYSDAFVESNRE